MVTHMDFDRVDGLRVQVAGAADGMRTSPEAPVAAPDQLAPAQVPLSAFGNTSGGSPCGAVWQDVVEHATSANSNLRQALDENATRLSQVMACFRSTDQESADQLCAAPQSITVLSAHLHSHDDPANPLDDEASRVWDDYLRAGQHDRLVDYASERPGAVAVGVDANVSIDRDSDGDLAEYDEELELSPRAVERFETEGFENVGDYSDGEPGVGTSSSDRSIDYIWSRGLDAGDPQPVDGGPSDHDGQVELVVPGYSEPGNWSTCNGAAPRCVCFLTSS